jgi:periplasmic protein TonB
MTSMNVQGQTDSSKCASKLDTVANRQVYYFVDKMPEFPGGDKAMFDFIAINIKYPSEADVQGRVYIYFIVEPDGQLTNKKVIRSIGGGCDEASMDVINLMPKWEPGFCQGQVVPVSIVLPIKFSLR